MSNNIKLSEVCFGNIFARNRENGCTTRIAPCNMQFSEKAFNEAYKPVELTDEWLIDLGFRELKRGAKGTDCVPFVHDEVKNVHVAGLNDDSYEVVMGGGYAVAVEHVHHLQNIFSANFGVELQTREEV